VRVSWNRKGNVLGEPHEQTGTRLFKSTWHEIHGGRTDEASDEFRSGCVVQIIGRADLFDQTCVHDHHAIRKGHRLHLVVSDIDRGRADLLMHSLHLGAHLYAQLGIEVGQRLIEQEYFGVSHDGAPHRHALPLSTGQLLGLALQQFGDVENVGGVFNPRFDRVLRHPFKAQSKRHVLEYGHVRIQGIVLKHHRDVPILWWHVVDQFSADQDIATGDLLESGDHAQRSALAATRWPDQDDELLVGYFQIDAPHGRGLVIGLGYVTQRYLSHGSRVESLVEIGVEPMDTDLARYPLVAPAVRPAM
jgi:hypothetical protein